jgi:D-amino-acid dehydrogenase
MSHATTLRTGQSVLIIGAGVVGVTTAYALAQRGLKVRVLDRNPRPGAETSFANGAQLSYAYHESIASPDSLRQLLYWMFRPNSPVILRNAPRNVVFAEWMLRYLKAAMPKASERHALNLVRLGAYSRQMMEQWQAELPLEFTHQASGILCLYRSAWEWKQVQKKPAFSAEYGFKQRVLPPEEIASIEPCLADTAHQFIGALHSQDDATGDPYLYTQALAAHCSATLGVEFVYDVDVNALKREGQTVVGAVAGDGQEWLADAVVLAAGSFSPALLRGTDIRLPVQPMKGYSITFDAQDEMSTPRSSISDTVRRLVHTRLDGRVRIAGFAEFAGPNSAVRAKPVAQLIADAKALIPSYRFENLTEWACLRAATPDGVPVLGRTAKHGLWMNTGHGMLGWTQAAGCADLLARQMLGEECSIPTEGYAHGRF